MTTVTTTIMQPIVKEVCVDYPGYFSTVPSTFTCSHAQISDPPKKAKKETISRVYPAVWPWTDCCRPSLIQAMVEISNARRSPNLTNLPRIQLRCAPIQSSTSRLLFILEIIFTPVVLGKQMRGRGPRGSTSCGKTLATFSQPVFCTGEILRLRAILYSLTTHFTVHITSIYCRTCKLLPP